jgi:hypothetical protein
MSGCEASTQLTGNDAVVLIPGIMGSALVEASSGRTLWGLDEAGWYVSAWASGVSLELLQVTPDEREGTFGRIRPAGLLRFPAFAPGLHGFEPYIKLASAIRRVLPDGSALLEFSYDWRLSVEHNAGELARAAEHHLTRWRSHPKGSESARLVLVGHSMGGLVARYFTHVLGGASEVALTVTLGSPFYGAVKAAHILNQGRGAPVPLPARRLRRLAKTMPGLHDLLPFYRCIDDGATARYVSPADVDRFGGDAELAAESISRHTRLMSGDGGGLRLLIGTDQPTMQSLTINAGTVTPLWHTCETDSEGVITGRRDVQGDGTVFRRGAAVFDLPAATLPQSHGAVAATAEAIAHIRDILVNGTQGPPLGSTELGIEVPDIVSTTKELRVRVNGPDAPGAIYRLFDAATDRQVAVPPLIASRDGGEGVYTAIVVVDEPGVYRVEVKSGGASPVVQYTMVMRPDELNVADEDDVV